MRVRAGALCVAGALLMGIAVSACGGDDGEEPPEGPGLSLPINLADCADWKDASVDERLATIAQLKTFIGGPVAGRPGAEGVTLDDEKAYDFFEGYCENEFARGFKLYKIYSRAAAFQSAEGAGNSQN